MARNTTRGYWRQSGNDRATPAPLPAILSIPAFAVTTGAGAGQPTGKFLPKGARVIEVLHNAAGTGGTSPTFAIGYSGTLNAFVANGAAGGGKGRTVVLGAPLAANQEVLVGHGTTGTNATGGDVSAEIVYVMDDDGSINN